VEAPVEVPNATKEISRVVVVEVGLGVLVLTWRRAHSREVQRHTTIAIPAHCTTALKSSTPDTTCHPAALLCTPPPTMTAKETSVQSSATTAKEIKKPTVRHMLQKAGCLPHSDVLGKGSQAPVSAEQRVWRPYENLRSPFWTWSVRIDVCKVGKACSAVTDPPRRGNTRNGHYRACICQSSRAIPMSISKTYKQW
jgi:hypothetical protein